MNEAAKKTLLRQIPHALYVLTAEYNGKIAAATVSWITQASFTPPLIVLGVKEDSHTYAVLKESRAFVLNYLGADQKDIAQKFFKHVEPIEDTLAEEKFVPSPLLKYPLFPHLAGYLECKVTDIVERGDHATVIAEVLEAELGPASGPLKLETTGWSYGG
jgi:flavin reductase (DIM6/NTAB) family NADH-FMN oxidoreductase RutF